MKLWIFLFIFLSFPIHAFDNLARYSYRAYKSEFNYFGDLNLRVDQFDQITSTTAKNFYRYEIYWRNRLYYGFTNWFSLGVGLRQTFFEKLMNTGSEGSDRDANTYREGFEKAELYSSFRLYNQNTAFANVDFHSEFGFSLSDSVVPTSLDPRGNKSLGGWDFRGTFDFTRMWSLWEGRFRARIHYLWDRKGKTLSDPTDFEMEIEPRINYEFSFGLQYEIRDDFILGGEFSYFFLGSERRTLTLLTTLVDTFLLEESHTSQRLAIDFKFLPQRYLLYAFRVYYSHIEDHDTGSNTSSFKTTSSNNFGVQTNVAIEF